MVNSFLRQFVRDEEVTFSAKEYRITPYLEGVAEEAREERKKNKNIEYFDSAESAMKKLRK